MPLDLDKLKTVSVASGEVTIRIPQRWGVWPKEGQDEYWGCFEQGGDHTGTLWIQVNHFDLGDKEGLPAEVTDMKRLVEDMASREPPSGSPPIESEIVPVDQGYCWRRVHDVESEGETLRFWSSHFFLNQGPHAAIIAFDLVLTRIQMDEPEFVEMREIMKQEISNAFLDPFRSIDERNAKAALGPLERCNFDDQVKLDLPKAMSISLDEGCEPPLSGWYCRLQTERSYAGMFVTSRFMEMRDENGENVLILPEMFVGLAAKILDEYDDQTRFYRMPQGVIAYDEYEDTEGIGKADDEGHVFHGFRNHLWRYVYYGEGRAQLLSILLILPLPEHTDAPYADLAEYMNLAVCRAQFPGIEKVEAY